MKVKLYAGVVTAAAAIGTLGMAGIALASPVTTAPGPVAHCNVILVGGYSPCFPSSPMQPIFPVHPIHPVPVYPINPGGPDKRAP